jgi:hypothetical protein
MMINIYIFSAPFFVLFAIFFISNNSYVFELLLSQILTSLGYPHLIGQGNQFLIDQIVTLPAASDLILYSIVISLFSFCVYMYANRNKYGVPLLILAFLIYPIANLYIDLVWVRRFVFFILALPILPRLWVDLNFGINFFAEKGRFRLILRGLLFISLLILVTPGFYLPPFYDGIAGWYIEKDDPSSYSAQYIRVRFKNNSVAYFRPSFFNPLTMSGRPQNIILRRDPEFFESDKMTEFLFNLYKNSYPQLTEKLLPTQKYLGVYAYKPHTFDRFDSREIYLPPDQVDSFEKVLISVDHNIKTESIQQIWRVSNL